MAERNIEAILDAVAALLERRSQPTIAAVATEAGVSRVTVYAHFPTREALLEAVIERTVQRTAAAVEAAEPDTGPAVDALERVIATGWRELDSDRAIAQAAADRLSPTSLKRAHESMRHRISELLARGRAAGVFRTDLPADWLITSFFALIHACGDEVRAEHMDTSEALDILTATIRDLFVGPRHT